MRFQMNHVDTLSVARKSPLIKSCGKRTAYYSQEAQC